MGLLPEKKSQNSHIVILISGKLPNFSFSLLHCSLYFVTKGQMLISSCFPTMNYKSLPIYIR